MFSRLFLKLFVTYAAFVAVLMVGIAWVVSASQEKNFQDLTRGRLRDSATMLKRVVLPEFDTIPSEVLQRTVSELGDETRLRITVIAADGRVLADSGQKNLQGVHAMDNHRDRPELKQALVAVSGQGQSQRHSDTLGIDIRYLAMRLDRQGQHIGWVRTGLPASQLQEIVNAGRRRVWTASVLVAGGLLLATSWLVSRIVKPVTHLTRAAETIAAGDYQNPIYLGTHDELGQLAETLNTMGREMDARITQLRETNQRLSTVLGGMTDGVIAINEHQQVLFANPAAGELMGFSPADAQGKSLLKLVRSHTLHEFVVRLLAQPGQRQIELQWGEMGQKNLLVTATYQPGAGSAGIVMVINNLTKVRRLEAMRRDFVANVSHELKTPLSSIKAYAETLTQGAINDEKHRGHFVRQIADQADRLNQLISDLLSLARIEAGKQQLEFVPVARVVELCVQEQQRAAATKQIELMVEAREDLRVKADEDGLRQILINLIDNAIKYTPESGQVTVGWREEQSLVVIYVQDTGVGIPVELQSRVFERFFRVDQARSSELGGTGLGLAIVKHLAQSFGGTVEVCSELGAGSCFTVKLPLSGTAAM